MTIKLNDFLDFDLLNKSLNEKNIKIEDKMREIHTLLGGKFYTNDIISSPTVSVCGIGGFPIINKEGKSFINGGEISKSSLQEAMYKMSGISSFMSYLNPQSLDLQVLGEKVVNKYKHLSVLHTMTLNLFITGISIGVEHEFSSQRDIIHLSRVTVAKTKAQNNPCLVLNDITYVDIYDKTLKAVKEVLLNQNLEKDMEVRNLLFPTAKASSLMISGSIKNILKLIELKDAGGKEKEFINILIEIENLIKRLLF